MAEPFWTRHKGPYVLQVNRDTPTRKQPWHCETLPGSMEGEEALSEAQALANDPRDPIQFVHIWSEYEECHVCTVRRTGAI